MRTKTTMREWVRALTFLLLVLFAFAGGGCASITGEPQAGGLGAVGGLVNKDTLGNGNIDLGGMSVPVALVATVADSLSPGSGAAIREGETNLQRIMGKKQAEQVEAQLLAMGFKRGFKFEVTLKEGAKVPDGQRVVPGESIERLHVYPFWIAPELQPASYTPDEFIRTKLPPATNSPPSESSAPPAGNLDQILQDASTPVPEGS